MGTFLGAIPAIIVALIFESPTIAVLTVVAYVLIQQLEGNLLTPRGSSPTEPRQGAARAQERRQAAPLARGRPLT